MKKHFVTFVFPGTFFSETSQFPISDWSVVEALEILKSKITSPIPFGFRFETRERSDSDLDSKLTKTSNMYYLGGKIETLEQIEARNLPDEEILRSNMRNNGYSSVIINTNSWKATLPLNDDDVVLDFTP